MPATAAAAPLRRRPAALGHSADRAEALMPPTAGRTTMAPPLCQGGIGAVPFQDAKCALVEKRG
jgi:hypothetical protein